MLVASHLLWQSLEGYRPTDLHGLSLSQVCLDEKLDDGKLEGRLK
jgi:hypothetical protein